MKKTAWILFIALAILIGLYPVIYFIQDRNFGLLSSKSTELLDNSIWNTGFYTHIILGGVALLTGWTQFGEKFRNRNLSLHRRIGKVYVIAVLLSSSAGIYIACFCNRWMDRFNRVYLFRGHLVFYHFNGLYQHQEEPGCSSQTNDDLQLCRLFCGSYLTDMVATFNDGDRKFCTGLQDCCMVMLGAECNDCLLDHSTKRKNYTGSGVK